MLKADLRKKYLAERRAVHKEQIASSSDAIKCRFLEFFNPQQGETVHIYMPLEKFNEIDTKPLIGALLEKGLKVYVPKVADDKMLSIRLHRETKFAANKWGISEPSGEPEEENFDYIITPLLYCDPQGNRVGYGQGFYDRFFTNQSGKKIGLSLFRPSEPVDDVSDFDVALDYLVLPTKVLSFGA